DNTGEVLGAAGRDEEGVVLAEYDLDEYAKERLEWGLFRDRRPDMYNF
ncbi:MAG: N-carbamoylputrescine amidase, partial [Clostridia bacterium]|nr:N-carbamoylputrescine amidase [Clostridia bacterium]